MKAMSMALVAASPLPGEVGKVYGFIVLDPPSALSSFNMLYLKIIRQVYFNPENIGEDYNG